MADATQISSSELSPYRGPRAYGHRLISHFNADAPFHLLIVLYTLISLILLSLTGASEQSTFTTYLDRWAILAVLALPSFVLILDSYWLFRRFRRRRRLAALRIFSPDRLGRLFSGVALLVSFMLFQGTFTSVKNSLSVWWSGFPYDRVQADIDAFLHFGVDPWRYLYAVARNETLLMVIDWNYGVLWFFVGFGALAFIAISPKTESIRGRFLLCFMLVWIVVGNVFAGLFMSAGPVYYGPVTGDVDRFAEQLAFLNAAVEGASSVAIYQNYLWELHQSGTAGFGSGISAFPSIHVALVTMIAMFAWEIDRRLGILAWAYVVVIQLSSVYLAWHYAIDGYASILIVVAIHLMVKRLPSHWFMPR